MVSAPSRTSNACTEWLMSIICASGASSRMTPFHGADEVIGQSEISGESDDWSARQSVASTK